jgi:hypothetical protein
MWRAACSIGSKEHWHYAGRNTGSVHHFQALHAPEQRFACRPRGICLVPNFHKKLDLGLVCKLHP